MKRNIYSQRNETETSYHAQTCSEDTNRKKVSARIETDLLTHSQNIKLTVA